MLTKEDLKLNCIYRSKKPKSVGFIDTLVDDRQIIYINAFKTQVQYDSPSVGTNKRYPTIPIEKFLKWADRDVSKEMPKGQWMSWDSYEKNQKS